MTKNLRIINTFALLVFTVTSLMVTKSKSEELKIDEMSIEDLMNVEVEVATSRKEKFREAPGILTVITAEDIKSMGARDLKEVLESVPGFSFGQDVIGVVSTINRGIWAQEGRMLILFDGVEMNETSYGTIQLTNHFPVEQISRIEIIRGPGSAVYGGFAELGVINITSKSGAELNGAEFNSLLSHTDKERSRFNNSFMYGKKVEDLQFSVKGTYNTGNASDNDYTDETGETASLSQNSQVNDRFLNFGVTYKDLYFRYIKDEYETKNIILWGDLLNGDGDVRDKVPKYFYTDAYNFGYDSKVSENLRLHAYFNHKEQLPWYQPDIDNQEDLENSWRRKVTRDLFGLKTFYEMGSFNLDFGAEHTTDNAYSLNLTGTDGTGKDVFGHNNERRATLSNTAVFAQLSYYSDFANITAGVRYDDPNAYDNTFVPRLGLTKVFGDQHIKFLYAQAFRAPVIENISLNDEIKPEKTTTVELEWGTLIGKSTALTLNIFDTKVNDIIVYSYDAVSSTEQYDNYDLVHTRGIEMETKYKDDFQNIKFNLSYYILAGVEEAEPFETDESGTSTFGAPRWKLYISDKFKISENFSITPSALYFGETYAKDWVDDEWQDVKMDDQLVFNVFANYQNLFAKGLEVGFGMKNITDANIRYAQPYVKPGDYQAGLYPGQSREYVARLEYSIEY